MAEPARLVEVLGTLSLASDLADGFAPETTVRSAVLGAEIARRAGGDDRLVADCLYGSLIRHLGCTAFAVEEAHLYGAGDDVRLRQVMAAVDFADPEDAVARITGGLAPEAAQALLANGPDAGAQHAAAQCDAAESLAAMLPISPGARIVASEAFERWDGTGGPYGRGGDDLSPVSRIVEIAYVTELFRGREGRRAAVDALRARAGAQLDPGVVAVVLDDVEELFALVEDPAVPCWARLLESEPAPIQRVSPAQLDDIARALGRFTDLKSTWFAGHSELVASVAADAARALGLDASAIATARLAALLHDIGRVGIATGLWDAPRPLSPPEVARVELHTWETHRIVGSVALFDGLARVASAAHERIDGSGYHRGAVGSDVDAVARVLAAADVAVALREDRPHRAAHGDAAAVRVLDGEVQARRLDAAAVRAVLDVTDAAGRTTVAWPAGLSDREVDVLRHVAAGASNKDTAAALGITPKTVAHHVEHIYDKIGVRSRAGATLFALQHGLTGAGTARR